MIQIAARALGANVKKVFFFFKGVLDNSFPGFPQVHINESASDKTANTPPTAASVGSDINGRNPSYFHTHVFSLIDQAWRC